MYKYYNVKTGKIKTYKKPLENPTSKGLKPVGVIHNMMLKVQDAFTKK